MSRNLFNTAPTIPGTQGTEPTLYDIILGFYTHMNNFSHDEATTATNQYIQSLLTNDRPTNIHSIPGIQAHFYIREIRPDDHPAPTSHPLGCVAIRKVPGGYLVSHFMAPIKKNLSKNYMKNAAYNRLRSSNKCSFIQAIPSTLKELRPLIGLNLPINCSEWADGLDVYTNDRSLRGAVLEIHPEMARKMETVSA